MILFFKDANGNSQGFETDVVDESDLIFLYELARKGATIMLPCRARGLDCYKDVANLDYEMMWGRMIPDENWVTKGGDA